MSLVRLRAATIRDVAGEISVPGYDRGRLQVGIVHFGTGAFHRSHQAMYVDRLMSSGQALDWAICAVDVLEAERGKGVCPQAAVTVGRCRGQYAAPRSSPSSGRGTRWPYM